MFHNNLSVIREMIHMKCQILFSLKNISKEKLKCWLQFYLPFSWLEILQIRCKLCHPQGLPIGSRHMHFDFFFFFFFCIFQRKWGLTFQVNQLPSRWFTWNAKPYFLWKKNWLLSVTILLSDLSLRKFCLQYISFQWSCCLHILHF